MTKFYNWLDDHPVIEKYLNPTYVFVEPIGAIPATIANCVGTLPRSSQPNVLNDVGDAAFGTMFFLLSVRELHGLFPVL